MQCCKLTAHEEPGVARGPRLMLANATPQPRVLATEGCRSRATLSRSPYNPVSL